MKKFFAILAIAGALTACNNEGDTKNSGDSTATDSNAAVTPTTTDSMNTATPPATSDSMNTTMPPASDSMNMKSADSVK